MQGQHSRIPLILRGVHCVIYTGRDGVTRPLLREDRWLNIWYPTPEFLAECIAGFQHDGIAEFPHDGIAEFPHDGIAEFPHDGIAEFPHDGIAEFPHDREVHKHCDLINRYKLQSLIIVKEPVQSKCRTCKWTDAKDYTK